MAERSKALVLGTSLFGGVGSNPTAAIFALSADIVRMFYRKKWYNVLLVLLIHLLFFIFAKLTPLGGLEPPTFRLTAERASRLRHRGLFMKKTDFERPHSSDAGCGREQRDMFFHLV